MPAVAVKRKSAVFGGNNNNNNNNNNNKEKENEDEKVFLEPLVGVSTKRDVVMQKKGPKSGRCSFASKRNNCRGHELSSGLDTSRAECYLVMDRLADAVSAASDALKMNGRSSGVGGGSEGVREHGERDEGEEGYRASARVVAGGFAH